MTLEDKFKEVSDPSVADIKQIYGDGQKLEKKIKLPKVVFDRVEEFNIEENFDAGLTDYDIVNCILGNVDEGVYWEHLAGKDVSLVPPTEFYQWLDEHRAYGATLIMLAVIYNNYELEDQEMKKEEKAVTPVVKRVKEEKADLDKKIKKLKVFLNNDEKLSNIGKEQVNLLRCQLETMEKYSDILWARIDDLEG